MKTRKQSMVKIVLAAGLLFAAHAPFNAYAASKDNKPPVSQNQPGTGLPDITPTKLYFGVGCDLMAEIKNLGSGKISRRVRMGLFRDGHATSFPSVQLLLLPGATTVITVEKGSSVMGAWFAQRHEWRVEMDDENEVAESDEGNNSITRRMLCVADTIQWYDIPTIDNPLDETAAELAPSHPPDPGKVKLKTDAAKVGKQQVQFGAKAAKIKSAETATSHPPDPGKTKLKPFAGRKTTAIRQLGTKKTLTPSGKTQVAKVDHRAKLRLPKLSVSRTYYSPTPLKAGNAIIFYIVFKNSGKAASKANAEYKISCTVLKGPGPCPVANDTFKISKAIDPNGADSVTLIGAKPAAAGKYKVSISVPPNQLGRPHGTILEVAAVKLKVKPSTLKNKPKVKLRLQLH